ncbi:MAG: lactate utilization protein C [Deinococcales bacterium]
MSARDDILSRIRAAEDRPATPPVRAAAGGGEGAAEPDRAATVPAYRVDGTLDAESRLALFMARLEEYGVNAVRCSATELGGAIAAALEARGVGTMVAPPGLPAAWEVAGATWLADEPEPLSSERLAATGGVLTGCAVAIAETGTLVLDAGEGQGRRALTLVPDYHLCVVRAEQIVQTVPEAMRRLEPAARAGRPITLVSGPSATSDIELSRVPGVHGPRTLDVVVVA